MARGTLLFLLEFAIYLPVVALLLERRKAEIPNWQRIALMLSSLLAFSEGSRAIVLGFLTNFSTVRYDQYINLIDSYLGNPSFVTRQFLNGHQWLWWPVAGAYNNLAKVFIALLFWHLWCRPMEDAWMYVRAMVISPMLAVLVYAVIPVSGPIYAYKDFPALPDARLAPHVIHIAARPNCIPSVHMTSAILILWFLRKWWVGRIFSVAFIVLTVLSTLGGGEHYLFDLLIAVPYTVLVLYLSGFTRIQQQEQESPVALPQESVTAT